jgi:hypothetical protein
MFVFGGLWFDGLLFIMACLWLCAIYSFVFFSSYSFLNYYGVQGCTRTLLLSVVVGFRCMYLLCAGLDPLSIYDATRIQI